MLRLPHAWLPLASLLSLLLFVAFLPRSSFGSTPAPRRALLLSILSPIEGRFPGDSPPTPLEISPYQLPFRQPSTLRKEEREKRNEERFPGEWFPEGYDVQEAAPVYTSSARTLWTSPRAIEIDAAHEKRLWAQTFPQGATLPPGKLMVNMLVKNEAEHLERTLPLWAKIVDYWIIGVDDANTDDSIAIIKKHLGHLPGEICEVHFDGIGPTWNQVAQLGIKNFPGATHGILADADYTPLNLNFDRSELSLWTSAQLFRVFNEEQTNERQLDWIYRNIPGARVVRRCHHSIQVPPQPGQSTDYYHIDTPGIRLSDRAGGYGDRAGGKQMKYIRWLEDDLIEWPNDGHTLYYLAHSHHDYFELSPRPENLHHVHSAVKYFEQRVNVTAGSPEGRFWALVKIAEMQTRWLGDDAASEETYRRAIRMDPWRVDGFFYYAKLYRSLGNETEAERILGPTHTMQIPPRSWFVWHDLYRCVARLEYARTVWSLPIQHLTDGKIAQAIRALNNAQCSGGDVQVRTAILSALSSKRSLVQSRLAAVARGESVPRDPELNPRAGGTAGQVVRPPGWSAEKEEEKRRRREKVRERKEREAEEKERQKLAAEEEKTETAEADKLHPKSKPSSAAADEDDDTPRKKPRAPPAKRSTRDDDSADDPSDDGAPKKRSPPQKKQRAPRRDGEEEEEEDRPAPRKRASTKASTPEPTKAAEPIRPSPPLPDSAAHFSTLTSFLSFFRENEREILEAIDQLPLHPQEGSRDPTWQDVSRRIASLLAKMEKSARTKKGVETCRKYRRATTPYLRVIHEHRDVLKAPSKKIAKAWEQEHEELRAMCR